MAYRKKSFTSISGSRRVALKLELIAQVSTLSRVLLDLDDYRLGLPMNVDPRAIHDLLGSRVP